MDPLPEPARRPARPRRELQIGPRLKVARRRVGLSLRALGERTGFSASFLSQVELGQVSPSLSSLGRIAHALEVTVSELLGEPGGTAGPVVRRRAREPLRSEWSRATVEALVPASAGERIEALLVTLDAGGRSGKTPLVHAGRELAFCVRGKVRLTLEDETHDLAAGDSVFYDAARARQWENPGKKRAEILLVVLRST